MSPAVEFLCYAMAFMFFGLDAIGTPSKTIKFVSAGLALITLPLVMHAAGGLR